MICKRTWSMPNKDTFSIKPIRELIEKYWIDGKWVDPFVRNSPFKDRCVSNDLNPEIVADYHKESLDFLSMFDDDSVEGVLYDPPYSLRQISECYKNVGLKVFQETTQSNWAKLRKQQIKRILKIGGLCLSFGWNSNGIGKTNGFEILEILLVSHGGMHNDTICIAERKID